MNQILLPVRFATIESTFWEWTADDSFRSYHVPQALQSMPSGEADFGLQQGVREARRIEA